MTHIAQAVTLGHDRSVRVPPFCLGVLAFGTTTDDETGFAVLDRYRELGGTFVDTSNNYAFWVTGSQGGESEEALGRWLASRGCRDEMVVATKVGARPTVPGAGLESVEGLSARVIEREVEESLRRLGTDHLDVYYAHVEDRSVPLEETVTAFGACVTRGLVRAIGASNHKTWRVERARALAAQAGLPGWSIVQQRYSYLQPRHDVPLPNGGHTLVTDETLDYVRTEGLGLVAYTPLLMGSYVRADVPLAEAYDHPGTPRRLGAVREVAAELGATPNQVVLAWLLGHDPQVIPLVGVSSVAQLEENFAALELELDDEHRKRLDEAR